MLWFYTPMMFRFAGACRRRGGRLRLHGRALQLPLRAARPAAQRGGAAARGPMWSSPAATASTRPSATGTTTSTPFRRASTPRISPRRGRRSRQPAGPGRHRRAGLGFYGVIDERIDLDADRRRSPRRGRTGRSSWSGRWPRSTPADLPRAPTSTISASKDYAELPAYLAGWDVALMPFAINEATRFISPTKTPEYLAGRPARRLDADHRRRPPLWRRSTAC